MALPSSYDNIVYPSNIDFFKEVANGNSPDNIVDARLVNKVQNAIMAMEGHMQFSCDTPTTTGNYMMLENKAVQLSSDLADPGLLLVQTFPVNSFLATQQFGGNPFNRANGIFVTGVGYKIVSGIRSYYQTRAAVNIQQENGNYTLTVNVFKTTKWRAGDFCEITVKIVRAAPEPP
jgi:hypothetical protein